MSRITAERGNAKREEIRGILMRIFEECAAHDESPEAFVNTMKKHIGAIKAKMRPQESHLVLSAIVALKAEIGAFKNNPYSGVLNLI